MFVFAGKRGPRHRGGFSVQEILISCALIGVLAAFAYPVLTRVLMRANCAACLSNQRQLGVALHLYANDHDGRFPVTTHTTGRRRIGESWIYELADYLEHVDKVRVCPADPKKRRQDILRLKATSYVLNDMVFDNPDYCRRVSIPVPSRTMLLFILSESRSPSATWDHIHGAEWTSWGNMLNDIEVDRYRPGFRSADRTEGSGNYLFADGHAENISAKTFKESFDAGTNPAAVPLQ